MRVPGWMPLESKILDLHKEFRQPEMLLYFKIFQSGPFKKYRDTHLVVAKTAVIPPLTVWRLIEFSLIKHYDHLPRPGIGQITENIHRCAGVAALICHCKPLINGYKFSILTTLVITQNVNR